MATIARIWMTYGPPFSDERFVKQLTWSFGMAALAGATHLTAGTLLRSHFPNPARPPDLILDGIPPSQIWIQISDLVIILQALLTIYGLSQLRFVTAPRLVFLAGTLYFLRSLAMVLRPLAQTVPAEVRMGRTRLANDYVFQGMFFSGHTGSAILQAGVMPTRRLRRVQYALAIVQIIALLGSHSHYSIDIFGALFVAYFLLHLDFMQLVPRSWRNAAWAPWQPPDSQPGVG